MRFPELAAVCANRGASMLVYPGAFATVTGPLHWGALQRARAVDNQCFVLTCSARARQRGAREAPARVRGVGAQHRGGPVRGGSGDDGRKRKHRDVRVRSGANRDAEAEHAAGDAEARRPLRARGQEAAVKKKRDFFIVIRNVLVCNNLTTLVLYIIPSPHVLRARRFRSFVSIHTRTYHARITVE